MIRGLCPHCGQVGQYLLAGKHRCPSCGRGVVLRGSAEWVVADRAPEVHAAAPGDQEMPVIRTLPQPAAAEAAGASPADTGPPLAPAESTRRAQLVSEMTYRDLWELGRGLVGVYFFTLGLLGMATGGLLCVLAGDPAMQAVSVAGIALTGHGFLHVCVGLFLMRKQV